MEIVNFSPYSAQRACMMDGDGAETLVVCVKGTFTILAGGRLALSDEQKPVRLVPQYRGEPGQSSLLHDADLCLGKPGTDCVLLGHAYPGKSGATETQVAFAVGRLRGAAVVSGPRLWAKTLGTTRMTSARPFERIPLVWENAYGGIDSEETAPGGGARCEENPVGVGFRRKGTKKPVDGQPLPGIEHPGHRLSAPDAPARPAGFGFVAPMWMPRRRHAGTYDDAWRASRSPLLPKDFEPAFLMAAPEGLSSPTPLGGQEEVVVEGASPDGRVTFRLPGGSPRITVRVGYDNVEVPAVLNTVAVEPDDRRVSLVWNGRLKVHGRLYDVGWIRLRAGS